MTSKELTRPVRVAVRPLTECDWDVVERLFGTNGACGGCWCMYWRLPRGGRLWEQNKGAPNKRALKKLLFAGRVLGCLAFAGDEPVGWCCLGPRADFPRLERTKALQTAWTQDTWSVVCFFVRSGWRHRGVASALLKKAVAVAREGGAQVLEGYPVRPSTSRGEIPGAFAWTGVEPLFEKHGFKSIPGPSSNRAVFVRRFRAMPKKRSTKGARDSKGRTGDT